METNKILEKLADLEHEQWVKWATDIVKTEKNLSQERLRRWSFLAFDYKHLTEADKEQDRIWARKVVDIIAQEILKHKDCKVMHNLGKHGKGKMTCLDKILESLGYNSELN